LVDRDLLGVGCSPIHLHAGIDLVSACDIRYTTKEAFFQIKEVDIGLAADVGTLQRMPKVVGNER
jgi:delta(3,5)-delta(2,4)-dienoyl-CoA isomerase